MLSNSYNSCIDMDECASNSPPCSWNKGVCTNTNGSFVCSCIKGWMLHADNKSCIDIDECASNSPPCSWSNGVCANTNGSFDCFCMNGWMFGKDNNSCIDINECVSGSPPCSWSNGVCTNTNGSYVCSCPNGWVIGKDNSSCVDINECTGTTPACAWNNGVCTNTNGSFFCSCEKGWVLNKYKSSCVDIDECAASGSSLCPWIKGICINTYGSYKCSCENGWALNNDNESCYELCGGCEEYKNKKCIVKGPTKAVCLCKNGYSSLNNMLTCEDVDDCASGTHDCKNTSICVNTDGGYNCSCVAGWILAEDGKGCQDVNECWQNKCGLDGNVTCVNKVGSYECICPVGQFFNYSKYTCQDINECLGTGSEYPCDPVRGLCENQVTPTKYVCSCPVGWSLSSDNICVDINECFAWCTGPNSQCKNFEGGYQCLCSFGFIYSNITHRCEQVDMCAVGSSCPINSTCSMPSPGKVLCQCINGYMMDHQDNCVEIDECNAPNLCVDKPHQKCENKQGVGIACVCWDGYERVGNFCQPIAMDECKIAAQANVSLCKSNQICMDTPSGFKCSCLTGYKINVADECEDVNECVENTTTCPPNAVCLNTNGSYYCKCEKDFVGENATDSSLIKCHATNIWSSWEQIGTCSELCAMGERKGTLKFRRFCTAIEFEDCKGEYFKEEFCNSEFCDNKIAIAKSTLCQTRSNMQDNFGELSVKMSETWLHKIKAWGGWKVKDCQQPLVDFSAFLGQEIDDVTEEIRLLNVNKKSLRNVVDCNSYSQQNSNLMQKYFAVYSRLTMYASIRAALKKLKSRIDVKFKECERDSAWIGDYASLLPRE